MAEVASAYVSLLPSARGFGRKMDGELAPQLTKSGESGGRRLSGALSGVFRKTVVGAAAATGAALGTALFKGFNRLTAIEDAQAKLRGLGNSAATVDKIMENALKSVQGTAFGLDEAATVAAGAVASGVKPGEQLERILSLVGDAATISGGSMSELGSIFNKVAATGKVQGDVLAQLGDRGIPILQLLSKQLKVTPAEVSKLASKGEIDFKTFADAMENGLGGAALKSGNTTTGAFKNMNAALGRFGAQLLKGVFPLIGPLFNKVTKGLDSAAAAVGPLLEAFSARLGPAIAKVAAVFTGTLLPAAISLGRSMAAKLGPVFSQIATVISTRVVPIVASLATFFTGRLIPAIVQIAQRIGSNLRPIFDALVSTFQARVLPTLDRLLQAFRANQPAIQTIVLTVLRVVGAVNSFATAVLGKLLPPLIRLAGFLFSKAVPAIAAVITIAIQTVAAFARFGGAVAGALSRVGEFVSGVRAKMGSAVNYVKDIPGKIVDALGDLGGLLYGAGQRVIQGLIDGIGSMIGKVGEKMGQVAGKIKGFLPGSPVKEGPLTAWNDGSPGRLLVEQGLLKGISSQRTAVASAMTSLTSSLPTAHVSATSEYSRSVTDDDSRGVGNGSDRAFGRELRAALDGARLIVDGKPARLSLSGA